MSKLQLGDHSIVSQLMDNEIVEDEGVGMEEVTVEQIWELSGEIIQDCQLKKGKKAKFIKHMERVTLIERRLPHNLEGITDQVLIIAFAALFKNIGKLGGHEESLVKAVQIVSKLPHYKPVVVRWFLQFAALKSSKKQHQECYEIAVKAFDICLEILTEKAAVQQEDEQSTEPLFIDKILEIARERTKDEIIWLVNQRSLEQDMAEQIKQSSVQALHVPYYPTYDFHIADYMSLESCERGWQQEQRNVVKEVVVYLSICCFTMATEKYYLKDYTQKYNHLKALKVALCAFDISCNYITFLLKILNQHFGKRLESIEEEHFKTAEQHEMKRVMPKDPKEVNLKFLNFADE